MHVEKKPKIAILSIRNAYNYGGVLSSLKIAYQFCEQYFDPKVFVLGFDPEISTSLRALKFTSTTKPLAYFGMNCIEVGARWAFWEPGHYQYTIPTWKKLLADYDYIFVVSGTCIAAHPAMALNKKFILWIGTPYDEDRAERVKLLFGLRAVLNTLAQNKMNALQKEILEKSCFTLAISTYAKEAFENIVGYCSSNIVHCGFPINIAHIPVTNLKNKEKILLAVGRFSDPRKNVDMLIRTFCKLNKLMPELKLYLVGKKPLDEKLHQFATLPCFKNIVFTGQLSTDDLHTLYKRAIVLLISSHQEGLGIVGLEALAHGTPVVATDCGGTKDYVINNVTGYLVNINDDDAMAAKVLSILSNEKLHTHLSLAGRRFIEERYSVQQIYSLFKLALSTTYPELKAWFSSCDRHRISNQKQQPNRMQDMT